MAKPLPKHPTLTPLRALDLLLDVTEQSGWLRGRGADNGSIRMPTAVDSQVRNKLLDHVMCARLSASPAACFVGGCWVWRQLMSGRAPSRHGDERQLSLRAARVAPCGDGVPRRMRQAHGFTGERYGRGVVSATIHIAGYPVNVGGHLRQLCAWCGHRLIDVDLSCVMSPPKEDGSPPDPYGTWETNALVKVDGNYSGIVEHDGSLPANACPKKAPLRLVSATEEAKG